MTPRVTREMTMDKDENEESRWQGKQEDIPTVNYDGPRLESDSILGKFHIKEQLGHGGAGIVYLAQDTKLDRPVAIKSIAPEVMNHPQVLRRWKKEAHLLATLNHPNIAAIYEEIEESEGASYLVLEYVPGETLTDRIARGDLSQDEAISIALQIVDALSASHEKGVIHRDLKPGNIKITPKGRVKVLDFGVGKVVTEGKKDAYATVVTQPGQVIGTPGYMSPEQTLGKETDTRSDIWSFGCVLYEMLTKKRPFPGHDTSEILESMLKVDPDWTIIPNDVQPPLRKIIHRCLEKDSEKRYQSAGELHLALVDYHHTLTPQASTVFNRQALLKHARRPKFFVPVTLTVVLVCVLAAWRINHIGRVRWARVEAIPEIMRLIDSEKYLAAFSLAQQAEKYIPKDPVFPDLWPKMSRSLSFITNPPGADISFKDCLDGKSDWIPLGCTPLENIKFPEGSYRIKIEKDGFVTRESLIKPFYQTTKPKFELWEEGRCPHSMVQIKLKSSETYWIDKYEVTNGQYKEFVDHGGYEKQVYWKHRFMKGGNELSWEQARQEFLDKSDRPGPSTWEAGTYPKGKKDYPVSGVSWYEAAAYAEFAEKRLPSIYHWRQAACREEAGLIIPLSNFGGTELAPVGKSSGIGSTGVYDMAGNVREWCWNAVDDLGKYRYVLGGAYNDPTYMFSDADFCNPWERYAEYGFRCITGLTDDEAASDSHFRPVKRSVTRDYAKETPVSTEKFTEWVTDVYAYDRTDLNAHVEDVNTSPEFWTREEVTFDAAYGAERVIAHLFLPKNVRPPYQTIIYFPSSDAFGPPSLKKINMWQVLPFLKSGRAFLFPVYKGTFERKFEGGRPSKTAQKHAHSDWIIQCSKDFRRSIDYLETRDDIDTQKIAFLGLSWGSIVGPIMLAVEERIKVGIFMNGGFEDIYSDPISDPFNFAPRVTASILMINGKEDSQLPEKTSQIPLYDSLGTASKDKKRLTFTGGHTLMGLSDGERFRPILDWLRDYLGPVD